MALAGAHGRVQLLAPQRILAQQKRFEKADQGTGIRVGGVGGRSQKGVAVDAGVGPEPQQAQAAAAGKIERAGGVFGGWYVIPGEQREFDGVDFHGGCHLFGRSEQKRKSVSPLSLARRLGACRLESCGTSGRSVGAARLGWPERGGPAAADAK